MYSRESYGPRCPLREYLYTCRGYFMYLVQYCVHVQGTRTIYLLSAWPRASYSYLFTAAHTVELHTYPALVSCRAPLDYSYAQRPHFTHDFYQ